MSSEQINRPGYVSSYLVSGMENIHQDAKKRLPGTEGAFLWIEPLSECHPKKDSAIWKESIEG